MSKPTEFHEKSIKFFKYFEVVLFVGFAITTGMSFAQYFQVPMKSDYVPTAMTGLTTLSGILSAFVGVWLSRQENPSDEKTRKWMKERSVSIIAVLVFGLLFVAGGLTSLVYQTLAFAFNVTVLGTLMIVWVVVDVLFFEVIASMEFCKKKRHTDVV
jgi:peptidoglycan biosynthesis protein MviN/MurJ (putative lipid II flippase)